MFVIGIDPHRGSHTAAVLDDTEEVLAELRVVADRHQRDRLLQWAAPFVPRVWAIEGATGTGALLAQQLVAAGEQVFDVPPTLSARVRLLDSGRSDKTDSHDARSAAVVALRHSSLRSVRAEDHVAVLRLLAKRHHDLIAARTRAVCRLHTTLCHLAEGHFPKRMTARQGAAIVARIRPADPVGIERKALARDLLGEIRRLDRDLAQLAERIKTAVAVSGTTVTDIVGVGPIVAAYLIGHTGDISRFPSAGHYARYNGTAPIEASSGPTKRHRLNPRGNRQLNHALHMAAVTQVRYETIGRDYYLAKQADGKSRKEAMRALKRRISDVVYRQLVADLGR
jgi:transposase